MGSWVIAGVLEGISDWSASLCRVISKWWFLRIREAIVHLFWKSCVKSLSGQAYKSLIVGGNVSCHVSGLLRLCQKKSPEQKKSEENGRSHSWANQENCEGLLCYSSIEHRGRHFATELKIRSFMKISNITHWSLWVLWHLLWYRWESYNSFLMTSLGDFQSFKC